MNKVTIGADPEVFVKSGRSIISVHDILPGTKEEPHPVEKGAIQVDGVAAEFNIDPARNGKEFKENIELVLAQLEDHLKFKLKKFTIIKKPVVNFSQDYFQNLPRETKILGCSPDYSAITLQEKIPNEKNLRNHR